MYTHVHVYMVYINIFARLYVVCIYILNIKNFQRSYLAFTVFLIKNICDKISMTNNFLIKILSYVHIAIMPESMFFISML